MGVLQPTKGQSTGAADLLARIRPSSSASIARIALASGRAITDIIDDGIKSLCGTLGVEFGGEHPSADAGTNADTCASRGVMGGIYHQRGFGRGLLAPSDPT